MGDVIIDLGEACCPTHSWTNQVGGSRRRNQVYWNCSVVDRCQRSCIAAENPVYGRACSEDQYSDAIVHPCIDCGKRISNVSLCYSVPVQM